MSRSFKVEGYRTLRESVTWYVTADNFDDARDKAECGDYDDFEVWDSDVEDEDVDEVTCRECDGCEGDCNCSDDPSEQNSDYRGEDYSIESFGAGEWVIAADNYTRHVVGSDPIKIISASGYWDDDNEMSVEFTREEGDDADESHMYIPQAAQFVRAKAPTPETDEEREEREEREAEETAAANQRAAEIDGLLTLLDPVGDRVSVISRVI